MHYKIYTCLLLLTWINSLSVVASFDRNCERDNKATLRVSRLVSNAEHTAFLKEALATAKRSVMISTYDVAPQRLFGEENLARSIVTSIKRGVAVYIYYEHRPWYEKKDFERLESIASQCARFEENANHSKCIIKDNKAIAIGSYNWLSPSREEAQNATIVFTGDIAARISKKVWEGIRFYQSLEYENDEGVEKFLQKEAVFSPETITIDARQFLYTLSTPEAHTEFLQAALHAAKEHIMIFSPFIRLQKLQRTFTEANMHKIARNGAQVTLITLPSPCDSSEEKNEIFTQLRALQGRYRNFSYLTYSNFHAKTLIADQMICEGSYNWLSAVNHIDHDANNFEMSVALKGERADALIQSFWTTELGRRVFAQTRSGLSSARDSKKRPLEQERKDSIGVRVEAFEENKKLKKVSVDIPASFEGLIRIFSGEFFGKQGYCVRFQEGDYLRKHQSILYFATSQQAKEAAYAHYQKITTSKNLPIREKR